MNRTDTLSHPSRNKHLLLRWFRSERRAWGLGLSLYWSGSPSALPGFSRVRVLSPSAQPRLRIHTLIIGLARSGPRLFGRFVPALCTIERAPVLLASVAEVVLEPATLLVYLFCLRHLSLPGTFFLPQFASFQRCFRLSPSAMAIHFQALSPEEDSWLGL